MRTHEFKGISRPHRVLQAFCSPLCHTRRSPHRFITTTKVHMATSNTTGFYKSKTTNGSITYTTSSHLHIVFHYGNICLCSGRRSGPQSARMPPRLFQQKDVSLPPSIFNIYQRDVCNHRSSKKMASVFPWQPFQNIHRSEKPKYPYIPNHPNTRTIEIDC